MDLLEIGMMALRIALMLLIVLQTLPLLIWMERKASAYMQDRRGPTYAHAGPVRMFGMVHTLTDVVKLIGKEDVTPQAAYKPFHFLAPAIAMSVALVTGLFSLLGQDFESAMTLTIAALTTTGPIAEVASAEPISYSTLSDPAKAVLAGAMILGRLEMLAIIALLSPEIWRR